jgi:hypothetical protein
VVAAKICDPFLLTTTDKAEP